MSAATKPCWVASIVTRLVLLYSLLIAAVIALFGWLAWRGSHENLLRNEEAALRHAAAMMRTEVQAAIGALARDAQQLSLSPTLREFVRSERTPEAERWRTIVEDNFRAVLSGKPSYFQVRLIGIASGGMELVRLDNRDGYVAVTPRERLQQKGDRDYFRDALQTPGGAVYLSEINLNRDFGTITTPHTPTLRAVKIVEDDAGTLHSLLVINMDLRPLLERLRALAGGAKLAVAAGLDDFLVHPDPARLHGSELGSEARFSREFGAAPADGGTLEDRGGELTLLSQFHLLDGSPRALRVAFSRPAETLIAGLRAARDRALRITFAAAAAGIALVVIAARLLAGRLRTLTRAVGEYEAGGELAHLPAAGSDEVGVLAARFSELAARVRESLNSAEAAVKARENFLAVMSHEIRTPMNAVIGLVRVLEGNSPAPHQAAILKSLGSAARNLMSLLDDALDWSKVRAGRMELAAAPFALHELAMDTAAAHAPLAARKGVHIEAAIAPGVPATVCGDAVRLGQVLHNLISNAVKFTDIGEVRLSVSADGEKIAFSIRDTGIGIPAAQLARVFEPFDQAGPDIAQRFGGTGLGLSITRELVRLMGGELTVASQPGEGAEFSFALPLPAAEAAATTATTMPDLSGWRILYIEDVPSNQQVLTLIVEPSRATLVCADTGAEGVAALAGQRFDIVLLDQQLPDTTGIALVPRLKAVRDIPVIALTAQASPAMRDECLAAGMLSVITKPVEPAALWTAIAAALPKVTFTALESAFSTTPEKLRPVLLTLAEEFDRHHSEITAALEGRDLEALRCIRHKMHTAIEQLGLSELRDMMDRACAGEAVDAARCVALIALTAAECRRRADG